jgi:hypothetical protein
MRLIVSLLALLAIGSAAGAQGWAEYSYPDYAFSVAFPAEPKIQDARYEAAEGIAVPARIYQVTQEGGEFTMTVAELSGTTVAEPALLDHAVARLVQGGTIRLDIQHRIGGVYGRQLSVAGADGSRSSIAVFYFKQRLYQIEGKALPAKIDGSADAIRFQQSLVFNED